MATVVLSTEQAFAGTIQFQFSIRIQITVKQWRGKIELQLLLRAEGAKKKKK